MKAKFITTEDKSGNKYFINISEIILIEEIDSKYKCIITLKGLTENSNSIKIESIHSFEELQNLILKK
jgi:hypothetical protein